MKNIGFNPDLTQKMIKDMMDQNCYLKFGYHEDLKALCINESDAESKSRDWNEMMYAVPLKWLREFCKKKFGVDDLDYYLQEEYTSDDSEKIFTAALNNRKVVMVNFI